ncbi:M3 family oligoendopeptidase [Paenibacillus sp. J2TS4]|uniref:M3 family oligoendopeptidase n=1 Tax=Paenibacillus sp. J2TS4 TaxID=2807194 RepID=UPI001B1B9649|nr:M3 family oligoendopeptidase [Paenibacillus sp. J2TS4]GIP33209.1 oligoendopeptidase [Paenibacillus sp. J2TS4]
MTVWAQQWELDSIFPGGSDSVEFIDFLMSLEEDMAEMKTRLDQMGSQLGEQPVLVDLLRSIQDLMLRSKHAFSFTYCLTAQDVTDQKAKMLHGRAKQNEANLQMVLSSLGGKLALIESVRWRTLISSNEIRTIRFPLEEMRELVKDWLAPAQEGLISDLAVEGYHSWMSLYTAIIRKMRIPFEQEGKQKLWTVEKLERVFASTNRQEREQAFTKYSEAFKENEEVISSCLNNLAGFRLKIYKHRGWDSVLKESLDLNRMSQRTLERMWDAVEGSKDRFSRYFARKAELLGVDKLSWFDLQAPLFNNTTVYSLADGVQFILQQFRRYSSSLADFTAKAFEQQWVETENRPNKSPVGFHAGFPLIKQSRIYKTYYGTPRDVATLAHELGHGYHQSIISELPPLAQKYGLNMAETASIFSERIVMNGLVQAETNQQGRAALLDLQIKNSVEYFFNVYTCYLFEKKLYEERKKGPASTHCLNEWMVEAQKKAFGNVFETYHPYYWASKFHLYISRNSFFNYPYTFGYLFSCGIYTIAQEEGADFENKYENLLRDSASMTAEQLAAQHLGIDLTRPEFWEQAVESIVADVDEFMEWTANLKED